MKYSKIFQLTLLFSLVACSVPVAADEPAAEIISVQKIWDQAPHNAFTDLVKFEGNYFCVFREGKGHVSPDGALRVLKSSDGKNWESAALITSKTADLRDAKISITPDNQLLLTGAGALHQPADAKHQTYVWFSQDGSNWGEAINVGDPNYWLWRIVWNNDKAYGVGYSTVMPRGSRFYESQDGKTFKTVVEDFGIEGYPNETGLYFTENGQAYCLIRRDGKPNDALLGTASAPYKEWKWQSLNQYVGGPVMQVLPDGRVIVSGRKLDQGAKTAIWELDPQTAKLKELAVLPSGGDTSYPGLVYDDGILWVSYYSSHEGKSNIYLAQVKLPKKS